MRGVTDKLNEGVPTDEKVDDILATISPLSTPWICMDTFAIITTTY